MKTLRELVDSGAVSLDDEVECHSFWHNKEDRPMNSKIEGSPAQDQSTPTPLKKVKE